LPGSLIKKINQKSFHLVVIRWDGNVPVSALEYSGEIDKTESHRTNVIEINDDNIGNFKNCYAGPSDPRLPEDIKKLPIGKREDFIETFNQDFYWYYKDSDPDYDENVSRDENRIRWALSKAYARIDDEKTEGRKESLSGDRKIVQIREVFSGNVPHAGFKEAAGGGYENEITVLQEGWSLNGNYYPKSALGQLAEFCQQMVVGYFNHGDTFNRDPRDFCLCTESGRVDGNKVKAKIHVFEEPDGAMLKERIEYAKKHKANHLFGVSVDLFARAKEGEREGREGTIVEEVVKLNSVDIVMIPSAGGRFDIQESTHTPPPVGDKRKNNKGNKRMEVKTLKEEHPDTAKLLIAEGRQEVEAEYKEEVAKAQAEVKSLTEKLTAMENELAAAKAKVDEYEQASKQAEFEASVKEALSDLPEEKRSAAFEKILLGLGAERMDTIREMIAERKVSKVVGVVEGEGLPPEQKKEEGTKPDDFEERRNLFKRFRLG